MKLIGAMVGLEGGTAAAVVERETIEMTVTTIAVRSKIEATLGTVTTERIGTKRKDKRNMSQRI